MDHRDLVLAARNPKPSGPTDHRDAVLVALDRLEVSGMHYSLGVVFSSLEFWDRSIAGKASV